jgi:hypothetical protein
MANSMEKKWPPGQKTEDLGVYGSIHSSIWKLFAQRNPICEPELSRHVIEEKKHESLHIEVKKNRKLPAQGPESESCLLFWSSRLSCPGKLKVK